MFRYRCGLLFLLALIATPAASLATDAPILIATVQELQRIGKDPNFPLNGSYQLTQDIDASETAAWNDGAGFEPIGSERRPFTGYFNGEGYAIRELLINRPDMYGPVGLFATVGQAGAISNLRLENGIVNGAGTTGALIGLNAGTVSNSSSSGAVTGDAVGGLVGENRGEIAHCHSTGSVIGRGPGGGLAARNSGDISFSFASGQVRGDHAGGLVAQNWDGTITTSYAAGTVVGDYIAGGLVGENAKDSSPSTISDCYAVSSVFSLYRAGGFAGQNSGTIIRSFSAGRVSGDWAGGFSTPSDFGAVSACYWNTEISASDPEESGAVGKTTTELMSRVTFADWDFAESWTIREGETYPSLQGLPPGAATFAINTTTENGAVQIDPDKSAHLPWSVVWLTAQPDPGFAFVGWSGDNFPQNPPVLENPLRVTVSGPMATRAVFLPLEPKEVTTIEELAKIGNHPEWPLHWNYILTTDLDASATVDWNDGAGFTPIGSYQFPFFGTFDGQGHVIRNLSINPMFGECIGLFSAIGSSAAVHDLGLEGGTIIGSRVVGALAGRNDGTVFNCFSTATVKGRWTVGGLIGVNTGTLSTSYAAGVVIGETRVGGLAGSHSVGIISDCFAAGLVEGKDGVGGLIGSLDRNETEVERAYSAGRIISNTQFAWAAIGNGSPKSPVTSVFFDLETTGRDDSSPASGRTTAQMMMQETFPDWDFENVWTMMEGSTYPTLRALPPESERSPLTATARHGSVEIAFQESSLTPGSVAVLRATPDDGYVFIGWAWEASWGRTIVPANPFPLAMFAPLQLEALFIPADPQEIWTLADLNRIGKDPDWPLHGNYVFAADIDASETAEWNGGAGFEPIGNGDAFTGEFNGQGFAIRNLFINRPDEANVGLFGKIGTDASIRNLGIEGGQVSGASGGSLAGINAGTVEGCWADSALVGLYCGGLVGENEGTIDSSQATGDVTGNIAGGFVSTNTGTISRSSASGRVKGGGSGGLVAINYGEIILSHATGSVTGRYPGIHGASGGLVGDNGGRIASSYATGSVSQSLMAGGLVGRNSFAAEISSSYATGGVAGEEAGGLVGSNGGKIITSFAAGEVRAVQRGGGLAGTNSASIIDSFALGPVYGGFSSGSLVGGNAGAEIARSYAVGKILNPPLPPQLSDGGLVEAGNTASFGYWDTDTTGVPATGLDQGGRTTSEMKTEANYTGWDFTHVWQIIEGATYPSLRVIPFDADFTLTIEAEHGTVETTPGDIPGLPFSPVQLTAIPDSGYEFAGWAGDGFLDGLTLQANPLPITVFQSREIRAIFLPAGPKDISTVADLARIGHNPEWPLHWSYRLVADIDASETASWNGGTGFQPIGRSKPFTGIFDGQGHRILNMTIKPDYGQPASLFHQLGNMSVPAVVKNLGLEGGSFTAVGAAAAGIAYENFGTIRNCYTRVDVTGEQGVAGLVALNQGSIENAYAAGNVTLNRSEFDFPVAAGGLVARNSGEIIRSYFSGALVIFGDPLLVGGLVGQHAGELGEVTVSFWNAESSGFDRSHAGRGLSAEQMKLASVFRNAGWGNGHWVQADGDYPRLAWENTGAPEIGAPDPLPFPGSGTYADPFLIENAADFASLSWHVGVLNKHLRLTADLDLEDVQIHPIGEFGLFTGIFDGGGFAVANGAINRVGGDKVSLFAEIGPGGRVQYLGAENMSITGRTRLGVLAAENNGSIIGCYVTGSVSGSSNHEAVSSFVGGLVGLNKRIISRSHADVTVAGGANSNQIGGLVGANERGAISHSYSRGSVVGSFYVGGLIGSNWGDVYHCYSTGQVSGNSDDTELISGYIGYAHDPEQVVSGFWDIETSGHNEATPIGIGKSTAEMKTANTFLSAGWDFQNTWQIEEGRDYPTLRISPNTPATPTTFEEWLARNGGPETDREPTDDPGGFGITNLERYALGLDPHQPDFNDLPRTAIQKLPAPESGTEEDFLTITFWESVGHSDWECLVEVSSDLQNWTSLWTQERTIQSWDGDWRLVTYRDYQPISASSQRFFRISFVPRVIW